MRTVICHFYNEEYLLPRWLNHTKKIFNHGIMLNNGSTDNSVQIIKDICPSWKIVNSYEPWFDAVQIDQQVQELEKTIDGWKMCLNVTEFLLGDINGLINNSNLSEHFIGAIQLYDWNPNGVLDPKKDIWQQVVTGVDPRQYIIHRGSRALHKISNFHYPVGRHFYYKTTEDVVIIHLMNCISSPEMLLRRLQIQHKIRKSDRDKGYGLHHYHWNISGGLTTEILCQYITIRDKHLVSDCSEYINYLVSKSTYLT